jgi:hypothetical protein
MLAHLLDALPIAMEITGTRMQAMELVSLLLAVFIGVSGGT